MFQHDKQKHTVHIVMQGNRVWRAHKQPMIAQKPSHIKQRKKKAVCTAV